MKPEKFAGDLVQIGMSRPSPLCPRGLVNVLVLCTLARVNVLGSHGSSFWVLFH